jgi:hypothetical protein
MCLDRSQSGSYEFHRHIHVEPASNETVALDFLGIPEDRTCGVVGIAAWNGDILERGSDDHLLTAFVERNPATGVWELTANFLTHNHEEEWDVDVLCLYNNPGVILQREYDNQIGHRSFNTGVSSDDYVCGVFGMQSAYGDINENGTGSILQVFTYIGADHAWYMMPDFNTNGGEEVWDISLLCVRRTSAVVEGDWIGNWTD